MTTFDFEYHTSTTNEHETADPYDGRFLSIDDLSPYVETGSDPTNLSIQVAALLAQQRATWEKYRNASDKLALLETKPLHLSGGSIITAQINPGRIRNTGDMSKAAVAKRVCFLDSADMDIEEKGIKYGDFIITVNLYPIVPEHLTIILRNHEDQRIDAVLDGALTVAADLSDSHYIFYNGPEVGASARDHAHLQAGSLNMFPIADDIMRLGKSEAIIDQPDMQVYLPDNLGCTVVIMESSDPNRLKEAIKDVAGQLPEVGEDSEPPVNIIFTFRDDTWTVYIFPRTQFRPTCFYAEGDDKRLISPASLEMGGIMVTARQSDYDNLTAGETEQIFADVCLGRAAVLPILETLKVNN